MRREVSLIALLAELAIAVCPLTNCAAEKSPTFLQTSSPNEPLSVDIEPCIQEKGVDMNTFDPIFHPAAFTCSSCDAQACDGCGNIICDLASCEQQIFFEEECWCRRKQDLREPTAMFEFREEDGSFLLDHDVVRTHCDNSCGQGVCGDDNLVCNTRAEACQPWWQCDGVLPPLAQPTNSPWPVKNEWLQLSSEIHNQKKSKMHRIGASLATEEAEATFDFVQGFWSCGMASHAPVKPGAESSGYVVLQASSCTSNEAWDTECSCWDEYAYQNGKDPKPGSFFCDKSCSNCVGSGSLTCASEAPQPKVIEIEPVAWMEEELEQNGLVIAVPRTASVASAQLQ